MENNLDVRVARLEERTSAGGEEMRQARAARDDLNQELQIQRVTIERMGARLTAVDEGLIRLQAGIDGSLGRLQESADKASKALQAHLDDGNKRLQEQIDSINANIRWAVLLVLGLILTAIVLGAIGGAGGHIKVQ